MNSEMHVPSDEPWPKEGHMDFCCVLHPISPKVVVSIFVSSMAIAPLLLSPHLQKPCNGSTRPRGCAKICGQRSLHWPFWRVTATDRALRERDEGVNFPILIRWSTYMTVCRRRRAAANCPKDSFQHGVSRFLPMMSRWHICPCDSLPEVLGNNRW